MWLWQCPTGIRRTIPELKMNGEWHVKTLTWAAGKWRQISSEHTTVLHHFLVRVSCRLIPLAQAV